MGRKSDYSPHDDTETRPNYSTENEYKEEASSELTPPSIPYRNQYSDRNYVEDSIEQTNSASRTTGWAALVLAIISWFVWPVLIGGTAAVVGFIAYRQGARGLGVWSMVLGLISLTAYFILIPLYRIIT